MKRYRIDALVIALAVILLPIASAIASTTASGVVDVAVTSSGGALSVAVSSVNFGQTPFSFNATQTAVRTLTLTVTDGRGTGDGWHVTIGSGPFAGTLASIPATGLTIVNQGGDTITVASTAGQPVGSGGPTSASNLNGVALSTVTTVIFANTGYGSGSYSQEIPVRLSVPGGTLIGSYQATLSVSVVSGP